MVTFRASDVDFIDMKVGEPITFESLRQAVVPPYVLIKPFIELPAFVSLVNQAGLNEDGIHGAVFTKAYSRRVYPGMKGKDILQDWAGLISRGK